MVDKTLCPRGEVGDSSIEEVKNFTTGICGRLTCGYMGKSEVQVLVDVAFSLRDFGYTFWLSQIQRGT